MTEVEGKGEMSQTQSGRSWHTAKEDDIPPLPRSRTKSTHDLASLATSKNLVEHLDNVQGEGWWSADKRLGRRSSYMDVSKSRPKPDADDEEDLHLAVLERLAKSSSLPHRERMPDPDAPPSPSPSPSSVSRRARPATSMDFRPRSSLSHSSRQRLSLDESRQSTTPRARGVFHGPRPSLVAGSTWMIGSSEAAESPRRSVLNRRLSTKTSAPGNDAPTRDTLRRGPCVSNKISPDIARRASWFTTRQFETESSTPSTAHSASVSRRTTSTTITVPSEDEAGSEIEKVKARHALELDAVLSVLSGSKVEVKELKEEVSNLHKLLAEGLSEREELRMMCKALQDKVDGFEGRKRRSLGLAIKGAELSNDGQIAFHLPASHAYIPSYSTNDTQEIQLNHIPALTQSSRLRRNTPSPRRLLLGSR